MDSGFKILLSVSRLKLMFRFVAEKKFPPVKLAQTPVSCITMPYCVAPSAKISLDIFYINSSFLLHQRPQVLED